MGKVTRQCANWLKSYMDFTIASEAPTDFHFWAAVLAISGALRRNVWFDQNHFKWYPNFYIIFVAKPGIATKSTAMGTGLDMLSEVDGIHIGPSSGTWQALLDAMQEAHTLTDFGDIIIPSSPVTLGISELGTFLDTRDTQMIDHLVHMWDGRTEKFVKRTRKDGEQAIVNPWVSFIGCTTPAWLGQNFGEYMIGGGFVSRTVFVFGESKRQYVAYPKRSLNGETYDKELGAKLVADLRTISELKGEFTMTEDAYAWGENWYRNLWENPEEAIKDDRMQGYVARKQGHVHKLAMVLSASKGDSLVITEEDLVQANAIFGTIELGMKRVFVSMGGNAEGALAQSIVDLILHRKAIPERDLYQLLMGKAGIFDIRNALTLCIKSGRIKQVQHENGLVFKPV